MTQTSRLVLEVDSRNAEQKAKDTRKALGALEDQGLRVPTSLRKAADSIQQVGTKSSEATQKVGGMERQLRTMVSMASSMAAPLAAAFSVAKIAQAAEEYTNLTNRLRLVTESSEQLARAQDDVFKVAQSSRQALDTTAQVYQRIAQNGKQLGLNLQQVASITETVAKSVALSGASAQAADAAMVQFGQALASGTLRGDELNSIMEQTPALAQAIARGLGVTIGELRSMGAEGKLTSEAIVTALQNQKDKVDELSSTLQVTASQAITAFCNSLVVTVGKLDQATSASGKFAQGILSLSQAMDRFNSGEFLDFFRDDKQTVAGLNNQLSETMSKMRDLGAVRAKLIKGEAGDTTFYKFKLYNVDELDKEISALEKQAGTITQLTNKMKVGAASVGTQSPSGDPRSAPVNPAYEKMLESLKKQAALQGENSEAAKVRYAIENGELGKLLPAQTQLLLKYAQEKDAKVAAAKLAKESKSYTEDAGIKALDQAKQQYAVLQQQSVQINLQQGSSERLGAAAQALIKWEQQLSDIKEKKTLTADQKSLLANQELVTAQLKRNAGLEKENQLTSARLENAAKLKAYQDGLNAELALAQEGLDNRNAGTGLGDRTKARLQEELKIRQDYQKKINKLTTDYSDSTDKSAGRKSLYEDDLAAAQNAMDKRLAMQQNSYAQEEELRNNWLAGTSTAWENYLDIATNYNQQAQDSIGQVLGDTTSSISDQIQGLVKGTTDLGDAFVNLATTMAGSVLRAISDIAAQWAVTQALKMAGITAETTATVTSEGVKTAAKVTGDTVATGSTLAALATTTAATVAAAGTTLASWLPAALVASVGSFGAAAIVGGAGLLAAFALIKGFSAGGYTGAGGVNDPAGIVHKGEVVWSQADIKRSGGVASVEALRKGNVSPIRSATKGNGASPGAAGLAPATSNGSTVVNLNEDASRAGQVQTSTGPDGKQIMEIFVSNIRSQSSAAKAFEQTYGLKRVGR